MTATARFTSDLTPAADIFDPNEVVPRNSPLMRPINPKIRPSPSPPPPVPRSRVRATQGDGVLVAFLDDGRHPEIARKAAQQPLPSDNETDEGNSDPDSDGELGGDSKSLAMSVDSPTVGDGDSILQSLAAGALAFTANKQPEPATSPSAPTRALDGLRIHNLSPRQTAHTPPSSAPDAVAQRDLLVLATPPTLFTLKEALSPCLPQSSSPSKAQQTSVNGELPPIQPASPKSDFSGHEPLPSIHAQLGDFRTLDQDLALHRAALLSRSPPPGPPRLSSTPGNHGSPPISPSDSYRRELPSPARSIQAVSPYFFPGSGTAHRHGAEYMGGMAETPSTEHCASTPATSITDRMSIDGITNPQAGGYTCTFEGCNAPAFQTQYLLNSHANVHSSARPHYCSVAGCPRSEGGRGFKRKNEMIRHGLVHDSPGYVCPFCPDREHKYPRPDNLQRHVRVHHVDKDKDDPLLRDVLAQRPDGPNRGRRRRGAPNLS